MSQRVVVVGDFDGHLADWWVGHEEAAERFVVIHFGHAAASVFAADPLGLAAGAAVQGQPAAAVREPVADHRGLVIGGEGSGDVADEQLTIGDPLVAVGEVAAHGGVNVLVGLERHQDAHAGVVDVVSGVFAGRKSTGDDVYSDWRGHGPPP